jgi:hypothetical protein
MPIEDRTWDLDRLPTKPERTIGTLVATFLFLITAAFFSFVTYHVYLAGKLEGGTSWLFAISLLLFLVAAVLLWRIAVTNPSKPTGNAISVTGYLFLGSGVALLVLCAINGTSGPRAVWAGLIAAVVGVTLVRNGKRLRKP